MGELSGGARRVTNVSASWVASTTGGHGNFCVLLETEDDASHVVPVTPAAFTAVMTIIRSGHDLTWDPLSRALVAANLLDGVESITVNDQH